MPPTLLHDFFRASAARHPEALAIEVPGAGRLTYAELDARSEALAAALQPLIEGGRVVALDLPRGLALYTAQLAVLKAGGAYTCLDPKFPPERVAFILGDAEVAAVLTDAAGAARHDHPEVWDLDAWRPAPTPFTPPALDPGRLAYLIYTSGTTGWPKGVMIEHRSIAHLVQSDLDYFDLGPGDRVVQSSSSAYDSSIEETWLALACGATVLVADDEVTRLGPDLVDWLRRERATVFCPPPTLLRAMACPDPQAALPDLRLLYVGGEALPRDVLEAWAPGRWMENGYGPTECTVTCVRGRMRPGAPITIGVAVAGQAAHVLDEALSPLKPGEEGELCMAGPGLARGYLNRPELTAEKFVEHPRLGRIYRTGDLVRQREDGAFDYLGRIDAQVKIRGYRVELGAVEAHLNAEPGVKEAACTVQDGQLVAFYVPEGSGPELDALRPALAEHLPSYMVPARFAAIDTLPTLTSGKLDRKALPSAAPVRTQQSEAARNEDEGLILIAFEGALNSAVPRNADFFEMGGDSLRAALAISELRRSPRTAALTVRDLYEAPSVAALAQRLSEKSAELVGPRVPPKIERASPVLCGLFQVAVMGVELLIGAQIFYWLAFHLFPWILRLLGLVPTVLLAPFIGLVLVFLWLPIGIGSLILAKKLLIGRYEAGRHPVWGAFYIRHWLLAHLSLGVPWRLLGGTVFLNRVLRMLGARVGERVHIHGGVGFAAWDLIDLGDDVSLGRDAAVRAIDYRDQTMILGPVRIGAGATLDTRAGVGHHTEIGPGAYLAPLAMVPEHGSVPADEHWDGVPAVEVGPAPAAPEPSGGSMRPEAHGWALIAARFGFALLTALPFYVLAIACIYGFGLEVEPVLTWLFNPATSLRTALIIALLAVGLAVFGLAFVALAMRMLGPVSPGVISRWSPAYIRVWLKTGSLEAAGTWLSGTLFWPHWLRLAGMKVGPKCEISTITDVVPELITVGRECFFADGIYLGGPRVHRNTVDCGPVRFGDNTFLGNHVVIPPGARLPPDILLGVCTVADERRVRRGSSWFGHPAFELPRREIVEMERSLTHEPAWYRWVNRIFWESLRFFTPLLPLLVGLAVLKTVLGWQATQPAGVFYLLTLPLYGLATGAFFAAVIVWMKWTLLGRVRPGQHALWSCWCSRWDFLYVVWGAWARPIMTALDGTPFLPWWLRLFGVKVGRGVFLGGGFAQVVDPDMLNFEDGATVGCMFQAHSFEDRVLKLAPVYIREGASVGAAACLMYGADIGARTRVGEHSVVMKHEGLLADRYYVGAPTRAAEEPNQAPGCRGPAPTQG